MPYSSWAQHVVIKSDKLLSQIIMGICESFSVIIKPFDRFVPCWKHDFFFLVCAVIDYSVVNLFSKMNKFFILLPETKWNIKQNVNSAVGHISSISGKPNPKCFSTIPTAS